MLWSPSESEAPRKSRAENVCFGKWFPSFLHTAEFLLWQLLSVLFSSWRTAAEAKGLGFCLCGWVSWSLWVWWSWSRSTESSDIFQCAFCIRYRPACTFSDHRAVDSYFHGTLWILHSFLLFTQVWKWSFRGKASIEDSEGFSSCILLFLQVWTIHFSFIILENTLQLDCSDVSTSLWLYFVYELHLNIIMEKFSLIFSQKLSKFL